MCIVMLHLVLKTDIEGHLETSSVHFSALSKREGGILLFVSKSTCQGFPGMDVIESELSVCERSHGRTV